MVPRTVGVLILLSFGFCSIAFAQPGLAEMGQVAGSLSSSFFNARDLSLVLAVLFGVTGAVRVYYNWQLGQPRITNEIAAWFFASVFMSLMGGFLQALYGL